MPRPTSQLGVSLILMSGWMSAASDLRVVSLPALEEQLVASRHEEKVARLRGFIVAEDHERAGLAGIWQGLASPLLPCSYGAG